MAQLADLALVSDAALQGYWQLESDGTDSSSNGYTLTTTAGPTFGAGKYGNCADFELDSSQFLSIADASCPDLEISGSQSWSFWVCPETLAATTYPLGKAQASTVGWIGFSCTSTSVHFRAEGLSTNNGVTSATSMTPGTWYHVVGVYDSTAQKLRIFVNGSKTEVNATGSHSDSQGAFAIGRLGAWTGGKFDGKVDDVAIFSRALTDLEVAAIYADAATTSIKDIIGGGFINFPR